MEKNENAVQQGIRLIPVPVENTEVVSFSQIQESSESQEEEKQDFESGLNAKFIRDLQEKYNRKIFGSICPQIDQDDDFIDYSLQARPIFNGNSVKYLPFQVLEPNSIPISYERQTSQIVFTEIESQIQTVPQKEIQEQKQKSVKESFQIQEPIRSSEALLQDLIQQLSNEQSINIQEITFEWDKIQSIQTNSKRVNSHPVTQPKEPPIIVIQDSPFNQLNQQQQEKQKFQQEYQFFKSNLINSQVWNQEMRMNFIKVLSKLMSWTQLENISRSTSNKNDIKFLNQRKIIIKEIKNLFPILKSVDLIQPVNRPLPLNIKLRPAPSKTLFKPRKLPRKKKKSTIDETLEVIIIDD